MAVFQTKAGVWKAKINYKDYTGKWRQAERNADGKRDAETKERELLNDRDALELPGQKPPTNRPGVLTVAEYLAKWQSDLMLRPDVRETTRKRYREALRPAIEIIGPILLPELTTREVRDVYAAIMTGRTGADGKEIKARSAKTALETHRVLRKALQDAVDIDALIVRNPAIRQIAPSPVKYEAVAVTLDQLDAIFEASRERDAARTDEPAYTPLLQVLAWTGARLGEMLALTWSNVDLDNGTLTISRALNTRGEVTPVKTKESNRTISLSASTVEVLRTVRKAQAENKLRLGRGYKDKDVVFATSDGQTLTQSKVNWAWKAIRKATGTRARIHDLRHIHATQLLKAGKPIADVAKRLGHTKPTTTLGIYTHALPTGDAELALDVDRIFAAK